MRRSQRSEQGSSLAWAAAFLTTVFLPLMLLVVDGARLLYVRGRLQTATDASCEAAAWTAGDRLRRRAERQPLAAVFHPPPRSTRYSLDSGPSGSSAGLSA